MKKNKIVVLSIVLLFIIVGLFTINRNKDSKIDRIVRTEAYSYLSDETIEYIKEIYEETGTIILTEKNKKENVPYLNPEYISYLSLSAEEKKEIEVIPNAYIIDYTYTDITESYPSYFDLRNVDGKSYISPMKNQETLGICWAFAAMEQAESYLLKQEGKDYEDNPIQLSPRQLDYATSVDGIEGYNNEFGYRELTTGGNYLLATQAMANGVAMFTENRFPFNTSSTLKSLNQVLNYSYSNYELNSSYIIPQLTDVNDEELLNNYINTLKSVIYNNGGGIISAQDPQGSCGSNNTDNSLILRADSNCNTSIAHDMQVIGWDDDYEYSYCASGGAHSKYTAACANPVNGMGAWIVRNSWGTNTATKYQYLYIAYDSNNYKVSASTDIQKMSERTWDRSYVEVPYTSSDNSISYYVTGDYTVTYEKSVGPTEKLEKIKFSTANSDGNYKVSIIADETNNFGDEIDTINTSFPGLYTIDVSNLNITFDNNISINIYSTDSGLLLYKGINAFTSYVEDDVSIVTANYSGNVPDDGIYNFNNVYIYSRTANVPSNSYITYELYDDQNNDLTDYISNVRNNYVAHNDILTKLSFLYLKAGHYTLRLNYNDQAFDSSLDIIRPPMVFYHKNYDVDEVTSKIVEKDVETNLTANTFSRTGYIFSGWNTMPDGSGTNYADQQAVTLSEDLILYAQWEPISYQIVFHSNNGLNLSLTQNFVYDESKSISLNTFAPNSNYEFSHWASDENDSEPHYTDGEIVSNLTTINNNVVHLYAIWNEITSAHITFDPNGGEGTMEQIETKTHVDVTLSKNAFTRTGYKFKQWNTKANGSGTSYEDEQTIVGGINENLTLYAIWEQIEYTIILHGNGGISNLNSDTKEWVLLYPQSGLIYLGNTIFTNDDYILESWNTTSDGTGTTYSANEVVNFDSLVFDDNYVTNLYAQWRKPKYKIYFNANFGTGSMDAFEVVKDEETALPKNTFTRVGYTFSSWNTKADGSGISYEDEQLITVESNILLYAQWQPISYKVVFHSQNGLNETLEQIFEYGTSQFLTLNQFTYTGYEFEKWASSPNGDSPFYFDGANVLNLSADNNAILHLYAIWTPVYYTIAFNANGGTGTMDFNQATYGTSITLNDNTFTKEGYHFTGWNTESDGTGTSYQNKQEVINLSSENNGIITLYAQWQLNQYTIVYDANGGTGTMDFNQATYDTSITLNDNTFTKEGYHFTGWNTESDGTGTPYQNKQVVINLSSENNGVITLYAQWEKEEDPYVINNYDYSDNDNYISGIDANTTLSDYNKNIILSEGYTASVDCKTVDGKDVLYTGSKTRIYKNEVLYKEITNIVEGDTNGDGKINYLDYVNVYNHIQKVKHPETNKKLLTGIYAQAGDMSNDDKISYLDYVRIYNKIKQLKGGSN